MTAPEIRARTCCFTGHRDLPVQQTPEIAARTEQMVRTLILQEGLCFFGLGGAIGYDTLAAGVVFRLRAREFPHIKAILVYPFNGFTNCWTSAQQADFARLLPFYDKVVCVSNHAGREAYLARDRHLVDGSAHCIAYCTRDSGGTAYTVRYALAQGRKLHYISASAPIK